MKDKLRRPKRIYWIVKDQIDLYNMYRLLPDSPWDEFAPEVDSITRYLVTNDPSQEEVARYIAKIFEDFFSLKHEKDFWLSFLSAAHIILEGLEKFTWVEAEYSYQGINVEGVVLYSSEIAQEIVEACIRKRELIIQIEAFFLLEGNWRATADSLGAHRASSKEEMWALSKNYLNKMKNKSCYFRVGIGPVV